MVCRSDCGRSVVHTDLDKAVQQMGWTTAQFECGSEMALVQPPVCRNGADSNGFLHLDREPALQPISGPPWGHIWIILLPHAPSGDGCDTRSEKDRQLSERPDQGQSGIEPGRISLHGASGPFRS